MACPKSVQVVSHLRRHVVGSDGVNEALVKPFFSAPNLLKSVTYQSLAFKLPMFRLRSKEGLGPLS